MASGKAVWGIDIGQCGLKAIKLRAAGDGKVEVAAFDIIEHAKILSQPDADPDEMIKAALEKFVQRNEWQGDDFVIGVPGQQTFARFTKLPPADPKKIPDLVRYEAGQQIPFDMDDVVWDYQAFNTPESPDIEVGIFAMRKELIRKYIDYFTAVGIQPTIIQTIPAALYNFARYDGQAVMDAGATVLVDVGAQNTDLIIVEKGGAWMRNIPLGGNNFTEALIKSFKLSFAKAENLKRTAAASKYARQIFQAMRPVFADLVAEIQRSLGFYSSTHRDVELNNVLALGNAFRLPGLQKYLENNLTVSGGVGKLEKFNNALPSATLNAPQFTENLLSLGAAYGLAVQGVGMASISSSLLPTELARIAMWKRKQYWFVAAAAGLAVAAVLPWARNSMDSTALGAGGESVRKTESIVREARDLKSEFQKTSTNTSQQQDTMQKLLAIGDVKTKTMIPRIFTLVHEAMPEVAPEIANAPSAEKIKELVKSDPNKYARTKRRQILIEAFQAEYRKNIEGFVGTPMTGDLGMSVATPGSGGVGGSTGAVIGDGPRGPGRGGPVATAGGGGGGGGPQQDGDGPPGFYVRIKGRLLYGEADHEAVKLLEEYFGNLRTASSKPGLGFYVLDVDPKNEPRKTNPNLWTIVRNSTPAAPQPVGRAGSGVVSVSSAAEKEAELALWSEPGTGEDTRTDWKFEIGFKIKLGDKPADPAAGGQPK
ncbi:MAG: pilus assembly protein PilM [Phycisphaerales bacterium]|nr:pilus assembly protein PilM [Phycisphaerales bacterium]